MKEQLKNLQETATKIICSASSIDELEALRIQYLGKKGELTSILQAVGGMDDLLDEKTKDREAYLLIKYLADEDKFDKVLEHPLVVKQPVVRNGRQATVGYQPEVWKNWE